MKKRFYALLLVLCMVISLLPAAGLAVERSTAADQPLYASLGRIDSALYGVWGDNWGDLRFYTDSAGLNALPSDAVITFLPNPGTAADAVQIEASRFGNYWSVSFSGCGSGTIQAVANGTTYRMGVISQFPLDGWSSAPTLTKETFLSDREFHYDQTSRTFYYVLSDSYPGIITEAVDLNDDLECSISQDGKSAAFTVRPGRNISQGIVILTIQGENGPTTLNPIIMLVNDGPKVVCCPVIQKDGVLTELNYGFYGPSVTASPGNTSNLVFYLEENGTTTPITDCTVRSSDSSVASIEKAGTAANTDNQVWCIRSHDFGSAPILFTFQDGQQLMFDFAVDIPTLGWYSSNTASQENWLEDSLVYSDTNTTFYAVFDFDFYKFNTFTLAPASAQYTDAVTIDVTPNSNYAKITIDPTANLDGAHLEFNYTGTQSGTISINLKKNQNTLVTRWASRDNGEYMEELDNDDLSSRIDVNPGYTHWKVFYRRFGDTVTALKNITSVVSSDETVATVEHIGTAANTGNPIYEIAGEGFGSATITVTYNGGKTLSMPVDVVLPDHGFSTSTVLDETTYLGDRFVHTADKNTFYFVSRTGTFNSFALRESAAQFADAISIDFTPGSSWVKITITDPDALQDAWLKFQHSGSRTNGRDWQGNCSIQLVDGRDKLVTRWVNRDNGIYTEELDNDDLPSLIELTPTYNHWMTFYLRSGATVTALKDITSVVSSDETVVTVIHLADAANTGNPVYAIEGVGFGSAAITVTYDGGKTLSMPVEVALPELGWYTHPTPTKDSWLPNGLTYTDTQTEFYVVFRDPSNFFDTFTLDPEYAQYANAVTVDLTPGSNYVKVTIDPAANLDDVYMRFRHTGSWNGRAGFSLHDGRDKLVTRWASRDNGEYMEELDNDRPSASITLNPGFTHWQVFCLRSGDTVTALKDITSVVSSDPAVATAEHIGTAANTGNPVYEIAGEGFGSATLTVTYDGGKTMTMPVNVVLPDHGFSTSTTLDKTTYLGDQFIHTAGKNTFYFVSRTGTFNSFALRESAAQFAGAISIDFTPGSSWVKITITDPDALQDVWLKFQHTGSRTNGGTWQGNCSIQVVDGRDKLVTRWARGNWNSPEEDVNNDYMPSAIELNPFYSHWQVFYLRSGGTVTPLKDITSVVSSDETVVTTQYMGTAANTGNPVYEVRGVNFGSATITVTYDGGKTLSMPANVVLPELGWSSAATMTQDSWLPGEFIFSETNSTLYFVAREGTLTSFNVTQDCQQYADDLVIDLSNGSYASITVKDPANLADIWVRFRAEVHYPNGSIHQSNFGMQFIASGERLVRHPDLRENGKVYEMDNEYYSDVYLPSGSETGAIFYVRSNGTYALADNITAVTSSDSSIVEVEFLANADNTGNPVYRIRGHKEGEAAITVTYGGGKTISMPVTVAPPPYGWSENTILTSDTIISSCEFYHTADRRTIYYVSNNGPMQSFELEGTDMAGMVDIAFTPGDPFAKVTLKDGFTGNDVWLSVKITFERGTLHDGLHLFRGADSVKTLDRRFGDVVVTTADPDTVVVVAAYQNGRLICLDLATGQTELQMKLDKLHQADTIKVFQLDDDHAPILDMDLIRFFGS